MKVHQQYQVAQNKVFNKQLIYDLQLVVKEEDFEGNNDATRCYDQIVEAIAVLALMRMDLSEEARKVLKKVLIHFRLHIVLGREPSKDNLTNMIQRRLQLFKVGR